MSTQARLLHLNRSSLYYQPIPPSRGAKSHSNVGLMRFLQTVPTMDIGKSLLNCIVKEEQ
jgi:hypothetical protein